MSTRRNYIKDLAEVKVNNIDCSPFHRAGHLTAEGNQIGWAKLTLDNSMLALPNYFLAALLSIHWIFLHT